MSQDTHDDDVIVISEEDVRYETADEHDPADPAGVPVHDDLAGHDEASHAVTGEDDRFGTTGVGDAETDPDAHPVTEPVIPAGSSYDDSAHVPSYSPGTAADPADVADEADLADEADVDPVTSDVSAGTLGTGSLNGTDADRLDGTGTDSLNGTDTGSAIPLPGAEAASTVTPAAPAATAVPESNWPQIQSLFVDDPQAAVRQAADVVGGALAALVAAANNREQTLRDSWQGDATGTEELRTALRDYRDLAGRLSTVAQDL
jgi:hypothetical protein